MDIWLFVGTAPTLLPQAGDYTCSEIRPAYQLKTVTLEHLRLDLRNRSEGLQLDEDASQEDEWRELKDAVADASQAHLGKTRRWDWVTGETIVLAEQARLARIQSAPNQRDLRRKTTNALRRDHNVYWICGRDWHVVIQENFIRC